MKLSRALLLGFVVVVAIFAGFNWSAIGTPMTVDYFIGSGELPLGVILLALTGIVVIFHVVVEWLRDASSAVEKWLTEKELNEALERALDSEDNRVSQLSKAVEDQHRNLEKKIDKVLDQFDKIKLAKLIEQEAGEVEDRIKEAEKGLRKDIKRRRGRSRRN